MTETITITTPTRVPEVDCTVTKFSTRERPYTETFRARSAKDRLYIWPEDYSLLNDLAGERWNKPVKLYRKIVPAVLAQLGLEGVKVSWSQYAGCSCGCSPGFVLDSHSGKYGYGKDIFVTFRDDAALRASTEREIKGAFASFME